MFDEIGTATVDNQTLTVSRGMYNNNMRPAIQCFTEFGEPWCRLSVNIPNADNIGEDEFAFDANNNGREQQQWLNCGHFQDTGKVALSGYCTYPIWKITTTD